jgi:hypothetical protein
MNRKASDNLPEPRHPFARWCAGATVGIWALSVQSFSDPWNKLGAILSPGVGYIIGLALDFVISRVSEGNSKRQQKRDLLEIKSRIENLYKERQEAVDFGADSETLKLIDSSIIEFRRTRIDMMIAVPSRSTK